MTAEGRGIDSDTDARIAELRRRLYSRGSADDPERAVSDRALLDELEAARAHAIQSQSPPSAAQAAEHAVEQPSRSEADPAPPHYSPEIPAASPRRSRRAALIATTTVVVGILGAAAATWAVVTAPASADALQIFDEPGTLADTSPFPPDYRLAGGSEIDELRSLGTFDGWAAWATLMDDDQVCLIAVREATTAATCGTRDQFARTGLTLGLAGGEASTSGNTAPRRDFDITWGPDDPKATTTDSSR